VYRFIHTHVHAHMELQRDQELNASVIRLMRHRISQSRYLSEYLTVQEKDARLAVYVIHVGFVHPIFMCVNWLEQVKYHFFLRNGRSTS